ncbi:MAG: MFS transporter [Propionibacteriaceae bacterium]|jgi:MFS family permease|nr:MFS transporter [Propionibacteriaceae bacterium]
MNRSLLAYQGSSVLSDLGNSLTAVVLPLLVLQTTGSVLSAGWLALATGLPQFLAAVSGGVALDRLNRRTVAIAGDLASAASIAGLALVHATQGLNLHWFIIFGCLSAVGDMPAMTARAAMAPSLAEATRMPIERIIAIRSGLSSAAIMAGPMLGAALIGWGAQNVALWITATTSTLAACAGFALPASVGMVSDADHPAEAVRRSWRPLREFAAGVRHLAVDLPLVRLVTLVGVVLACAIGIVQGLALPYLLLLTGHPGRTGITLACLALGVAVGAGCYAGAHRRLRPRAFAAIGGAAAAAGLWLLATLPVFGLLLAAMAVIGAGMGLLSSVDATVSVTSPDPELRGRVLGNQNALTLGLAPFATLGAALGIEQLGLGNMLAALAAIVTAAIAFMAASRSWRLAPSVAESEDTPGGQDIVSATGAK